MLARITATIVSAIVLALLLSGCSGGGSSSAPPPSFSIAANPTGVSVSPNASTKINLMLTVQNGFSGTVTVSLSGLPNEVTASPSSPFTLTASGQTVTLTANSMAAIGSYSLTFQGTSGSLTSTATVALDVVQGLSISLLAPSNQMVGIPVGLVTIYGYAFSTSSQVLVNGQPINTLFQNSGTLEAQIDESINTTPGTYQFSVQNGSTLSNSLPYTVYLAQQGPFVMQAIPGFVVGGEDAPFIVAADVNGDSLADVVMPGPPLGNSNSIAILNGQADGLLSAPQYIPVVTTPYAMAVGDIDGNGTPDLVPITTDNFSSTTVSIMLGDGHGNFQQPSAQQTFPGYGPGPAYLADIDGDGKPDLVLAVQQTSGTAYTILWLQNTGGSFGPPTTLVTSTPSKNFCVADFNGDGKPDILYTSTSQALHILINQGNGRFSDQAAGGLNGISGLATVLDFNLDGIPDLIVQVQKGNAGVLYSFEGKGNGSFQQVGSLNTPGPIQLVSGDFDHDGFPDLAGPSGLEPSEILYFFGDGRGNFVMQPVVGPEGQYVAVGDFNGDGIPDVVVPDRFTFVSLALGRTDRNFPSALALSPATMTELSAGDINGDGLPEIFVGGDYIDGIPGTVFLNQNGTAFPFAANTDPSSFMIADLTGKGVFDLLGGATANLEIWPNNGTLNFSSSPITLQQPSQGPLTIADMDGDGCPDIVAVGQIFYGNCAYQFTPEATTPTFDGPYVVGDFNGDGKLDIAAGSLTYLNIGNRTFQTVQSGLPLSNGTMAAVGDFNGDGKDDVAINLPGDSSIAIYYSKGDGTFYQGAQVDPGQYPGAMVVGDFNGDGRPDLAVGLMLSQQACLLFNSGNGEFSRSFFASGADVVAMIASDLNRDGKPDLVIGNFLLDFAPPNVDIVFHK
jgi:VCBS repeat protein